MLENEEKFELDLEEIELVSGGVVCGGVCVGAAFTAGAALGYIVVDWALN
ncbi:MAG: hypothetical protein HRU19_31090 [Pseudobacteriovorax sp.]|nr:hypothetical protein [Pseudobacteriovorax sp.]